MRSPVTINMNGKLKERDELDRWIERFKYLIGRDPSLDKIIEIPDIPEIDSLLYSGM